MFKTWYVISDLQKMWLTSKLLIYRFRENPPDLIVSHIIIPIKTKKKFWQSRSEIYLMNLYPLNQPYCLSTQIQSFFTTQKRMKCQPQECTIKLIYSQVMHKSFFLLFSEISHSLWTTLLQAFKVGASSKYWCCHPGIDVHIILGTHESHWSNFQWKCSSFHSTCSWIL